MNNEKIIIDVISSSKNLSQKDISKTFIKQNFLIKSHKFIATFLKTIKSPHGFAEIYKNPKQHEIYEFASNIPGARCLIVDNKDLYVWKYDNALHKDIINSIPGKKYMCFVLNIADNDTLIITRSSWSGNEIISKSFLQDFNHLKQLGTKLYLN